MRDKRIELQKRRSDNRNRPLKNKSELILFRFEIGAGFELDGLGSLNLNFFLGLGVDAGTSLALHYGEGSEADELKLLLLLYARLDGVENGIQSAFSASFGSFLAEEFLYFYDEFCFIHSFLFFVCLRQNLHVAVENKKGNPQPASLILCRAKSCSLRPKNRTRLRDKINFVC